MSIEMKTLLEKIGEKLKELRLENNLTQSDVANILKIGQPNYSRYESGEREISVESLCILADYYKVSLDYLVGRED